MSRKHKIIEILAEIKLNSIESIFPEAMQYFKITEII